MACKKKIPYKKPPNFPLNKIKANKKSVADFLIIPMIENLEQPITLATKLRNVGINTEIYLNDKK